MAKPFYVTTPIYYTNAAPHVGHAYASTMADIVARHHKLLKEETFFLTGTADHGQKIVQTAEKQGVTPRELTDQNVLKFQDLYAKLGIEYDFFIRNSDKEHHWPGAQALWRALVASGDIYKASYEGLYCIGCEKFLTEKDLVDGKCPDHDREPELVSEENYFFRLSKYGDRIAELLRSGEIKIAPENRLNELLMFIENGLEDVSFSRPADKMSWGIPVPDDASHTMYVWCEELSNYISAIGYGRGDSAFKKLWPVDVHIVGKDILRFHAIIWPAMLLSAGLPLPKGIFAHGLIMSGGRKMSKTIGNVIDPQELITEYGAEAVRYYFTRHIPPFSDGDLTREGFREAYNGNLVNGLGNQVSRIMTLAETHLAGPIVLSPEDEELESSFLELLDRYEFNRAADLVWEHIGKADEHIQETEPFKRIKSEDTAEQEAAKEAIAKLVKHMYKIAVHLAPIMPATSEIIKEAVRANKKPENLFPRLD